ncbi:hypothetical protein PT974_02330 [Cladobotryum mycophilum]|uniref:DUF1308 domain-containing protein n=1 Tax=Cladobotryum mycophilum TaxID=491253 RepID=A0ABR0SZ28_9HYPO
MGSIDDSTSAAVPEWERSHQTPENEQEQDAAVSRQHMLDEARRHLSLSEFYIPEIERFLEVVSSKVKTPRLTGLPAFIRKLKKDYEIMQWVVGELAEGEPDEETLKAVGRKLVASATIIQHEAVHWDILKRCRSFAVVDQTFQGSDKEGRRKEVSQLPSGNGREKQQLHRTLKEQSKVEVDAGTADDRQRLGLGEYELGDDVDPEEWEDMPLAKQIRRLVAAARINRHDYRIPRVRVIMPNLSRGDNTDIDVLLDQLTRLDPSVEVVIEDSTGDFMRTLPPPDFETAVRNLMGDEMDGLTDTLNMDHTILIDLISDITHSRLEPQPWQAQTTRAQIEEEIKNDGLMARTLYPILQGRSLVCTQEAAEHFHQVLSTVGTPTEKERGRLLVPFDDETRNTPPEAIRSRFAQLSIHPLPHSVQIPIRILPEPWTISTVQAAISDGRLPHVALDVAKCGGFKSSKLSIYMYGWASGVTTVTSNKEVRGQIRTWVETNRRSDEELGPVIWRVDVTRNLLAKSATPPAGFIDEVVESGENARQR